MTWARWIVKNLARNRRRTILTVGSVAASLFLVALLAAGFRFLSQPSSSRNDLILTVSAKASMTMPMPLWYRDRIAALPGVLAVSPFDYLAAHYGGDQAIIPALALDPNNFNQILKGWKVPPDEIAAFQKEKIGLLVGRKLAEKYHWRIGQQIQFRNDFFTKFSMPFVIRGIYTDPANANGEDDAIFHWDYLNEAVGLKDRPYMFWVRIGSGDDAARVTKAIDNLFLNSPVPVRTATLKQFMLDYLKMLGNVKLVLIAIMGAVMFSVLLVVTNTMAMTIRERTPEIATLRTLGFRRRQILGMLTIESLALAFAGAVIGALAAKGLALALTNLSVGEMPVRLPVDGGVFALVVAVGLVIAFASTILPAYRASRIRLADALRFVG